MGLKQRAAVSICIDMKEHKILRPGRLNSQTEAHVNHLSADSPSEKFLGHSRRDNTAFPSGSASGRAAYMCT